MSAQTPPLSTPEDATPAWLAAALAEGGLALPPGAILEVVSEPLGTERSNLANIARLRLKTAPGVALPASLPRSLIMKFASTNSASFVRAWRLGRREVSFYQRLAGEEAPRTPRCYFAALDDKSGDFTLLLEDLGAARNPDQESGALLEDARVAIDHLARFHGHFWQHPLLDACADWLPLPNANREAFAFFVSRAWRACAARYPALPTSRPEVLDTLERVTGPLLDRLSIGPITLLHGDCRLDNMFFASEAWPEPFAIIDWQLALRGRGMWDVAIFLVGSLTPADHAAFAPALLSRYHAALSAAVGGGYSLEACTADYHAAVIGSFSQLAVIIDQQLRSRGAPTGVFTIWIERLAAAVQRSLDSGELLSR